MTWERFAADRAKAEAEVERLRSDGAATRVDLHVALEEVHRLQDEIATMRPIVEAVATAQSVHAETLDIWVLLLDNHTLSTLQELIVQARAYVAQHPTSEVSGGN